MFQGFLDLLLRTLLLFLTLFFEDLHLILQELVLLEETIFDFGQILLVDSLHIHALFELLQFLHGLLIFILFFLDHIFEFFGKFLLELSESTVVVFDFANLLFLVLLVFLNEAFFTLCKLVFDD